MCDETHIPPSQQAKSAWLKGPSTSQPLLQKLAGYRGPARDRRASNPLVDLCAREAACCRICDVVDLGNHCALVLALLAESLPRDHDRNRALGDEIVGE